MASKRKVVKLKPCRWVDCEEYYDTECGGAFTLNSGTPADNSMVFCPYCGEKIAVVNERRTTRAKAR